MKFKKVFIIVHNREHYNAVCNELERLGYESGYMFNKYTGVITTSLSGVYLDWDNTAERIEHLKRMGYVQVKRTRHLRKVLGHHTTSQDALSKLEVLPRSNTAPKSLSAPYGAYNDTRVPDGTIVQTLGKYWQLGVQIVKAAVSKIIKHFK